MHVLVIGALGQLGTDVCAELSVCTLTRADLADCEVTLDIHNEKTVAQVVHELKPDVVVNTAAAHDLRCCEEDPALAFSLNALGALFVARACATAGARLVFISTDYVFNGVPSMPNRPYIETDLPAPLNVYAASKLAGEHLVAANCPDHLIARTAALYGLTPCRGKEGRNFVETMLGLAAASKEVKVVREVVTSPTYTCALARQLRVLAERAGPGLYHATCQGMCSWYDFAQAIFEETGTTATLVEAHEADFQSPVRRPAFTALDNRRMRDLNLDVMPSWREALKEYTVARRQLQRATV